MAAVGESDIMLMAEHFAIQMCREIKLPLFPGFTERAKETLLNYRWPGNIRELKNVVERSVYRHGTSDYPLDDIIIDPFKRRPNVINSEAELFKQQLCRSRFTEGGHTDDSTVQANILVPVVSNTRFYSNACSRAEMLAQRARGEEEAHHHSSPEGAIEVDESEVDLDAISAQSLRLVRSILMLIALLSVIVLWSEIHSAFGFLENISLWDAENL